MASPNLQFRETLSPQEFVTLSGLSLATVRRYLKDGRLAAIQHGGRRCRVLIPRSALTQFLPAAGVKHAAGQGPSGAVKTSAQTGSKPERLSGRKPLWLRP